MYDTSSARVSVAIVEDEAGSRKKNEPDKQKDTVPTIVWMAFLQSEPDMRH